MATHSTAPEDYPVRNGTINFGTLYESVTAAILSLHHCRKNEMWLSRNLDNIGNFDDIVLKIDKFTCLIQVKYNNKNEMIPRNTFTQYKEKEQFCLKNCLDDYLKLKSKVDKVSQDNNIYKHLHDDEDNLKYILHTNREVAECDFLEIVDSEFYYKNNLSHGQLYKFNTHKFNNQELLRVHSYPNLKLEFFNNLYLYSEKMLFKNTDNATMLSTELKELLTNAGCNTMCSNDKKLQESAIFYKHFFEQWETCLLNDTSTHNYPLTRDHVVAKVTEIILDEFSFKLKNIIPGRLSSDTSWNSLKDANITITDHDARIYPFLKKYILNKITSNLPAQAKSGKCKIYHQAGNADHCRWCMWIHKLVPLVLEIERYRDFADVVKFMQLLKCSLSILILKSTRKDWPLLEKTIKSCQMQIQYLTSSKLLSQNRPYDVENTYGVTNSTASITCPQRIVGNANEIVTTADGYANINLQQIISNNGISIDNINIKDKLGKTVLHYAASKRLTEKIKEFLHMGANPDAKDSTGKTPLHCAVDADDIACITCLLDRGVKIDEVDHENTTPLLYAVKNGQTKIVELLLLNNANTNIQDLLGRTALYLSVSRDKRDIVALLLSKYASTDIQYDGDTILHIAIKSSSIDILTLLIENVAKIDTENASGQTAICTAVDLNKISVVALLLNQNTELNWKYKNSNVLHHAIGKGFCEIVELLLEKVIDINMTDSSGKTGLYLAVKRNNYAMVKLFLEKNANTSLKCEGSTALHRAVMQNSIEIVQLLLDKTADVNQLDSVGRTALHFAVDHDNRELVLLLLNRNANTEVKFEGNTVLHHAVTKGLIEIIDLLLSNGAKSSAQNSRQKTALHLACDSWPNGKKCSRKIDCAAALAHAETVELIVKLLLERGAKIKIQDCFNKTALHYAENLKSNIGKYLDDSSRDYTEEEAENYFLLKPDVIKCYEDIASFVKDKWQEINGNNSVDRRSREE